MNSHDVCFHDWDHIVDVIEEKTVFSAYVEDIDSRSKSASLTTLPFAEREMDRLEQKAKSNLVEGTIQLATATREGGSLHVCLGDSVPVRGILLTARVRLDGANTLHYEKGYPAALAIRWQRKNRAPVFSAKGLKPHLDLVKQHSITWHADTNEISYGGRMSYAVRSQLLREIDDGDVRESVETLYRRSNQVAADIADLELEKKVVMGTQIKGRVEDVTNERVYVRLRRGAKGVLPIVPNPRAAELQPGHEIHVFVSNCEVLTQRVDLMLAQPLVERVAVLPDRIGRVMGKQGERVREIERTHRVLVTVEESRNAIKLIGTSQADVSAAARDVRAAARHGCRCVIEITGSSVAPMIGGGGSHIRKVEAESGADISVDGTRVTILAPTASQVDRALSAIRSHSMITIVKTIENTKDASEPMTAIRPPHPLFNANVIRRRFQEQSRKIISRHKRLSRPRRHENFSDYLRDAFQRFLDWAQGYNLPPQE